MEPSDWINRIRRTAVPSVDLTETDCPVCGESSRRLLIRERGYPLWKCAGCSHVYISPRPSERWLAELYSSEYLPDTEDESKWEHTQDIIFDATARAILRYHPQRGDLLDVGSGFGGFLVRAKQDGWRLHGIEPNAAAIAVSKKRLGDDAHLEQAIFEAAHLEPESYDGIVMLNVIEHVREPREICRRAFELLRPDGFVGLRWPQMSPLNLIRYRLKGVQETNRAIIGAPLHLQDYNRLSMEKLLTNCGFENIQHAWSGTRRPKRFALKNWMAASLMSAVAHGTHVLTGGRHITPFIARISLARKPSGS